MAATAAARDAEAADHAGRLTPETLSALMDTGIHLLFVPPRWGGTEGTFTTWVTAVARIGEGCASAAWVAAVLANFGRLAGFLPLEGQHEIWSGGPDVRLVGAVAPSGHAVPVPGGRLLSGNWRYVSGAALSDWALLAAWTTGQSGRHAEFFAVPRPAYQVSASWSAPGMRGTGSDTLSVEGVFVPDELTFRRRRALDGRPGPVGHCLAVPSQAVSSLGFVAPALGAATAALAAWAERLQEPERAARPTGEAVRIALARSAAEVDAARLLVDRAAATADRGAVTRHEALRNARDAALAADLLSTAVSRTYRSVGTGGQSEPRFQRPWRDITTAAGHALLSFEATGRSYADELITCPPHDAGHAPQSKESP